MTHTLGYASCSRYEWNGTLEATNLSTQDIISHAQNCKEEANEL